MKKIMLLFVLVSFVFSIAAYAGQEDKIIDRYKKATGGDAIKKITNRVVTGSVTQGNFTGQFLAQSGRPDRIRLDIEVNNSKLTECYNGNSAWQQNDQNLQTLINTEAKTLRLKALLTNTYLRDLSKYRVLSKYLGKVQVNGVETEAVEFNLNGVYIKVMFDPKTGLIVKEERQLNEGIEETFYQNYQSVNKVAEPFLIKIKRPNRELEIKVDKIEHNTKLTETAFRYPSVDGSKPIPDIEEVIKALTINQEKIKELRELYSFRSAETQKQLDGDGQVKETTTRVYEVTPIVGTFVQRLISVNGVELSKSDKEKEDKKVKKEIENAKKEQKKRENKKKDDDDDSISIQTFLKILSVKDARRDKFRGQEVLIFDFEPRKDFKPKNLAENIVSKLVGSIFIDENAKQIARLEARLSDSVKIGGGLLASLSPSSAFVFEQEKIRDEVWLPSYEEINFGGKAFLFVKFNQNQITQYSDYRKYQTDVEIKADPEITTDAK